MNTREIFKSKRFQIGGVSVLAFALGAGTSYLIFKKEFERVADKEIESVKERYRLINKEGVAADPTTLLKSYKDEVTHLKYDANKDDIPKGPQGELYEDRPQVQYDKVDTRDDQDDIEDLEAEIEQNEEEDNPEKELLQNIFGSQDAEKFVWNYEEEVAERTAEYPYVISFDEFNDGETGYEQSTVTYFEGDDVLADEGDQMIDEIEATVGEGNLYRFGHGSKDNKIVYVRNEKLNLDFEIIHSDNKYAQEVLGFIEHSDKPEIRRFRSDDG